MKASHILLSAAVGPTLVLALWRINVTVATAALGAIGYTCATGALPNCAIAAVASLIIAAMSSYNSGHGGGEQGSPVKRDGSMAVSHFHPDGRIFDHVNNSALEVGVWHRIVSNNVELLASKHASGNNVLTAVLPSESTAGNVKRAVNPNAI